MACYHGGQTMHSLWIDLHDFCVIWMTAVIWLVQVLVYPNFRLIPDSQFKEFHKRHCDRISFLVAPMFAEPLIVAMVIQKGNGNFEWIFHGISIGLILTATAVFSAPTHSLLAKGPNEKAIDYLVRSNRIRTLLWSLQLILILTRKFQD
jgi:hypothetical protein